MSMRNERINAMDFVSITRKRARVPATRRPLPSPPQAHDREAHASPSRNDTLPQPEAVEHDAAPPEFAVEPSSSEAQGYADREFTDDGPDVRWEKVHAVRNAIASGHYDVEGRLASLPERFVEADAAGAQEDSDFG